MQKIWYASVGVVLFLILGYVFFSQEDPKYPNRIEDKRFQQERFFLYSENSPFKDKSQIPRLAYFAPDVRYKVEATIKVFEKPIPTEVKTSKGTVQNSMKYAYLEFTLLGKSYKLLALRDKFSPLLWVGFTDATTGKETYGGGRYLELPYRNGQKKITLDFNLAYNPYCAYSEVYACPIPPKENALPTRIEAGEKNLK